MEQIRQQKRGRFARYLIEMYQRKGRKGRIRQEKLVIAIRYGLLTNGWTEQFRFQEVFGEWKSPDLVSGSA